MKRLLVLLLVALPSIAIAQPVVSWRPPMNCAADQFLKFNGTVWVCGTVSTFSTNNVIPKGNGTTLVSSSWTDNGTTSTTTGRIHSQVASSGITATTNSIVVAEGTSAVNPVLVSILSTGHKKIVFGNGTNADDGQIEYDATGRDMRFRTAQTVRLTISSAGDLNGPGSWTLGDNTGADAHAINGAAAITSSDSNTATISYTGTGQTADRLAGNFINSGSYNTTLAQRIAYGTQHTCSATESAGGNTSICIGGLFTASGLDDNRALQTNAGDVRLNVTGGQLLTFGSGTYGDNAAADSHLFNGLTTIKTGTPTTPAAASASSSAILEVTDGNHNYLSFRGTNQLGMRFTNASAEGDGFWVYTNSRSFLFGTAATVRAEMDVNGKLFLGDTANTAVTGDDALDVGGFAYIQKLKSESQIVDYTRGFEVFYEFLDHVATDDGDWSVVGLVDFPFAEANRPGVLQLVVEPNGVGASTTTTALMQGASSSPYGRSWFAGGGELKGAWGVSFSADPSTTNFTAVVGMMDEVGDTSPQDGIYFLADDASSNNWQVCAAENGTSSCVDTSPAIALEANDWYRLEWTVNAAGTLVTYTVSNVTDATSGTATRSTNIPNDSTHTVGLGANINRIDTAASGELWVDFAWLNQTFTTAR